MLDQLRRDQDAKAAAEAEAQAKAKKSNLALYVVGGIVILTFWLGRKSKRVPKSS